MEVATQRYWSMMECRKLHVRKHGEDMTEVKSWRFTGFK
jgi:hypothetical protein